MFEGLSVRLIRHPKEGVALGVLKPKRVEALNDLRVTFNASIATDVEKMSTELADELENKVGSEHVAVLVWDGDEMAAVVRGEFFADADVKKEFYDMVQMRMTNAAV